MTWGMQASLGDVVLLHGTCQYSERCTPSCAAFGYLEEIVRLYEVWLGHLIFQTEEIRETI